MRKPSRQDAMPLAMRPRRVMLGIPDNATIAVVQPEISGTFERFLGADPLI
jgi:hypothetical protein